MATQKSTAAAAESERATPPDRKVECRVIAANFAGNRKGSVVKVPESYLKKVPRGVLITLEEEKRLAESREQSSGAVVSSDSEKARREAWAALEDQRVTIHRDKNMAEAKLVLENAGLRQAEDLK